MSSRAVKQRNDRKAKGENPRKRSKSACEEGISVSVNQKSVFFSVYFCMLFARRGLSGTLMRTSLPTWAVMWSGRTKSGVLQIFSKKTSLPESQDLTLVATFERMEKLC